MHAMQVCAKHGKKRQVVYLQRCPQTNEWVCKPSDQCKLCGTGNASTGNTHRLHFTKERPNGGRPSRHSDTDWLLSASREKLTPPERNSARGADTQTSERVTVNEWLTLEIPPRCQTTEEKVSPALPQALEDDIEKPSSTSIITSWADEVDKEFPFPQNPFPQNAVASLEELAGANVKTDSTSNTGGGSSQTTPHGRSRYPSDYKAGLSLAERVEFLEEELSMTKRELTKTRQNLSRIIQNEKTMETKVRNLCSEIIRMRQQQLQLDLTRSGEDRRASVPQIHSGAENKTISSKHVVIGGRLNPDAMPFLPSAQLTQMDSGLSSPTADSARSTPYIEGGSCLGPFCGSSLSLQPAFTVGGSTIVLQDSARSTQQLQVDSARSTQNVDSARTASARSSNFSVATNGSIVSLDSDQLEQFSPRL